MPQEPYTFTISEETYARIKTDLDELLASKSADPLANVWVTFPSENPQFTLQVDRKLKGHIWRPSSGSRTEEANKLMAYELQNGRLPDDITMLVNLSYKEAIKCYAISCFLAAIALCGRTIETVLGGEYQRVKGVHPSADTTKPGVNAIINELKRQGHLMPTGLKEKMEAIAVHRNMAIHGNLVVPSEDEARSAIYATKDVLRYVSERGLV